MTNASDVAQFTTALEKAKEAFQAGEPTPKRSFAGLLYLHRFDLRLEELLRLGKRYRLPCLGDDLGYLVHAGLTALFGELAPRTFAITHNNRGILQVLGYSEHELEKIQDHANIYAPPDVLAICNVAGIASKCMPSRWKPGTILGYQVRACPTVRLREPIHDHRKGAEVDAFLLAQWEQPNNPELSRSEIYQAWLAKELLPHAKLVRGKLSNYRLEPVTRRSHHGTEHRAKQGLRKPSATFEGVLEINSLEFGSTLARGIGRHRAFGLGMLLLQPCRA